MTNRDPTPEEMRKAVKVLAAFVDGYEGRLAHFVFKDLRTALHMARSYMEARERVRVLEEGLRELVDACTPTPLPGEDISYGRKYPTAEALERARNALTPPEEGS